MTKPRAQDPTLAGADPQLGHCGDLWQEPWRRPRFKAMTGVLGKEIQAKDGD